MSAVRLVCFDLGGVVVRLCRSWDEGCLAAGVELRPSHRTPEQESARRAAVNAYQRGDITSAAFFQTVADSFGGVYAPAEVERVHGAWIMREYEGVAGLIGALGDAGVPTACLSNTNAAHWRALQAWPAVAALGSRHASHEMRLAKPDPAVYEAFERVSVCAGPEILFFEDTSANADAARERGWRAEVVDPAHETRPQIEGFLRAHGVTVL